MYIVVYIFFFTDFEALLIGTKTAGLGSVRLVELSVGRIFPGP